MQNPINKIPTNLSHGFFDHMFRKWKEGREKDNQTFLTEQAIRH